MTDHRLERRLSAVLAADVVGHSRSMHEDEDGTMSRLQRPFDEIARPVVEARDGRIFKRTGDGFLAEFPSAVGAALAAEGIRSALAASDIGLQLRIGLHLGDVIVQDGDLYGDGVNIASRLEGEAEPQGILASALFARNADGRSGLSFAPAGQRRLKNVEEPVAVFVLQPPGAARVRPHRSRRPVAVAFLGLAAVAAAVAGAAIRLRPSPAPSADTPRVAVLRFENLSGDPEQDYFAEGLAEDLITDLAKVETIEVLSPNSSFAIDPNLPTGVIAVRLSATHVVSGSVRRSGDLLRISARLIDAAEDRPTWAERHDGSVGDVFAFRDRIRAAVIEALRVNLADVERVAVDASDTRDAAAYDAHLRGLRAIAARRRLDSESVDAARAAFEEAVRLGPDYALAHAGLAWAEYIEYESVNSCKDLSRAFELAERSMDISENALAHRTLAKRHFNLLIEVPGRRDPARSLEHLEAARRLQPGDPDLMADLAATLPFAGRPEEAVDVVRRAMELNPAHPRWCYAASGVAYLLSGRTDQAQRGLGRWSAGYPDWHIPHLFPASAYGNAGMEEEARAALDRYRDLAGAVTLHAANRTWPMPEREREVFNRGLVAAGME